MHQTHVRQKIILVVSALCLTLLILEGGLRLGGRIFFYIQERRNLNHHQIYGNRPAEDAYRILCIGESTTAIGGKNGYPYQLQTILNDTSPVRKCIVINKGMPAADTGAIAAALPAYLDTYKPHLVIAMMGVNDSILGLNTGNTKALSQTSVRGKLIFFLTSCRVYTLGRTIFQNTREKIFFSSGSRPPPDEPRASYTQLENYHRWEIIRDPADAGPYIFLGRCAVDQGNFAEAETAFKEALKRAPRNDALMLDIAWLYKNQRKYTAAVEMVQRALEINPDNIYAQIELAWYNQTQSQGTKAQKILEHIQKKLPQNDRVYGKLAVYYQEQGDECRAAAYFNLATLLRLNAPRPFTEKNYRKVKEMLTQRGIPLICVQYPMRNIAPLKQVVSPDEEVIFVDNEKWFKDALTRRPYREYFTDDFGGDFGHGTRRGNELLARNIAETILKSGLLK